MAWTTPKTWAAAVLTSADMNTHVRDNENFLKLNTAYGAASELTISGGVVAKTQAYHKITGEGTANDDLNTISGGAAGEVIILRPNGQEITLKNGTGNLTLGRDILLNHDVDHVALVHDGSVWVPLIAEPLTMNTITMLGNINNLKVGTSVIAADAAHRGQLYFIEGAPGGADKLWCIMKSAGDTYSAIQIAIG